MYTTRLCLKNILDGLVKIFTDASTPINRRRTVIRLTCELVLVNLLAPETLVNMVTLLTNKAKSKRCLLEKTILVTICIRLPVHLLLADIEKEMVDLVLALRRGLLAGVLTEEHSHQLLQCLDHGPLLGRERICESMVGHVSTARKEQVHPHEDDIIHQASIDIIHRAHLSSLTEET